MERCIKCGRLTGYSEEEEGYIMDNGDILCSKCADIYLEEHPEEEDKQIILPQGESISFEDFISILKKE